MLRVQLGRHKGATALVVFMLVLEVVGELLKPWPTKFVIDYLTAVEGGDPQSQVAIPGFASGSVAAFVIFAASTLLIFALFDGIVAYIGKYRRRVLGADIGASLRSDAFGHLQRTGLTYHRGQRTGELTSRVVTDTKDIEEFIANSVPTLIKVIGTFASMVAIMLWLDWRLALVCIVLLPPVLYKVIIWFVAATRTKAKAQRATEGDLTALTQESLQAVDVVKAFSRERFTDGLFERANQADRDAKVSAAELDARFAPTVKFLVQVGVVVVVTFGIFRVRAGAISTGDLWIFLAYFRGIKSPLRELSSGLRQLARSETRWDRVREVLSEPIDEQDENRRLVPPLDGRVTLRDVHFAYNADEPVLSGVSLEVPAGARVAVLGETGSGKSTLMGLVAGLYTPDSGRVELDGLDVAGLNTAGVRDQIAFVLQESVLFATTIGENILYGRLDASPEEVVAAARQAGIHDQIMELPRGYGTIVGERGSTLSGGQRQRVAIARAILRDARILILDEPVTGLDPDTKERVWEELESLMEGRTTLLITHEPALAARMDAVHHLIGGRLVSDPSALAEHEASGWWPDGSPPPEDPMVEPSPTTPSIPSATGPNERLVVMGQGYVGLPLAMRAVESDFEVVGYDVDEGRVRDLARGRSFTDDVPAAVLASALSSGRYRPTSDRDCLADFDIAVVSVPTPLRDGIPELGFIEDAARDLAPHLVPGATVILESTTYPGTTEELLTPILEDGSGLKAGHDFFVGYSPERINPGDTVNTFVTIPKIVSGIDAESLRRVERFYGRMIDSTVPVQSTKVAELAKLMENTFRHVNIALVNELAMFAHDLGIDVWDALDAASTKPFGYMRFNPGPGVGGHCLPVDPSYLSWDVRRSLGRSFRFVELANDINEHMPDYVVRRLTLLLNEAGRSVNGARVLILGLSYKRNTGDTREAPSLRIIQLLSQLGAGVVAADPHVASSAVPVCADAVRLSIPELQAADAVVLVVDHSAFDLDLVRQHAPLVLDCTRRLAPAEGIEVL